MIDRADLPSSPQTILVTRLDALGDIVLGTMLLSGLHAKWPEAKIRLIVRPQMIGVAAILPEWVEVTPLPFDPRLAIGTRESDIVAQLRAFASQVRSDLAIVSEYNRTWAGEILAKICGAPTVLAFDGPSGLNFLHREICTALDAVSFENWKTIDCHEDARETAKYAAFLAALGIDPRQCAPFIVLRAEDRHAADALWSVARADPARAVICFPSSGELLVRSLDAAAWSRWIGRLKLNRPVVLLGTEGDLPVLDAIEKFGLPEGVSRVTVPTEKIGVTAAFLERGGAYIGMDTGPMHIAAVLGRPTLGVFGGGHRAERFLPVGRRAAAVRMPLGCYGCDWFCPFDSRLCIKEISEWPLCEAGDEFLNEGSDNADPFSPRIYNIRPPAELSTVMLGPIMRQHRRFLKSNHQLIEHHAYLARHSAQQDEKLAGLSATVNDVAHQNHERGEWMSQLSNAIAEMTRHNTSRDAAITRLHEVIGEMTRHNDGRDSAINHLAATLAAMTGQNASRDEAIAHLSTVITEMSRQNGARDEAISQVNQALAEMTRQNRQRDEAINHINRTLAEMTRQNESRDQAIANLAQ